MLVTNIDIDGISHRRCEAEKLCFSPFAFSFHHNPMMVSTLRLELYHLIWIWKLVLRKALLLVNCID